MGNVKLIERAAVSLAVLALVAACNDASGPTEDAELNADVAMVVGDATIESVGLMFGPDLTHLGRLPGRTRTVTYYDANGNVQPAYDRETTATIHTVLEVSREAEREGWSASIERVHDMTISGLLGQETTRIFNGTRESTVTRSRHVEGTVVRSYEMEDNSVIDDVVVPVPGSDSPWPLSGTITHTLDITATRGDETKTVNRVVVITFNGTQFPTMTVNGEPFELDLGARPGKRPIHVMPRGRR